MGKKMYDLVEVAEKIGVKPRTVRKYVAEGTLTGFMSGRRWRFTDDDVDDYIKRMRERANEARRGKGEAK